MTDTKYKFMLHLKTPGLPKLEACDPAAPINSPCKYLCELSYRSLDKKSKQIDGLL